MKEERRGEQSVFQMFTGARRWCLPPDS